MFLSPFEDVCFPQKEVEATPAPTPQAHVM